MRRAYAWFSDVVAVVAGVLVARLAGVALVAAASCALGLWVPALAAGSSSPSSPSSFESLSAPNAGGTTLADLHSAGITSVGTLRCTRRVGQQMRACRFRAIRRGGYTTVIVDLPGGGTRAIFFDPDGAVLGVARTASQTPTRMNMNARQRGDVTAVSVGAERFEVGRSVWAGR